MSSRRFRLNRSSISCEKPIALPLRRCRRVLRIHSQGYHKHGRKPRITSADRILPIVMCSALAGSTVSAQTSRPAQPDLEATVTPGMTVWITDAFGHEEKARIVGVSGGIVTITGGGAIRHLRTSEISRVRVRQPDPVISGFLIGAGAAVASGLFVCRLTEPWEVCRDIGPIARIGAIGGGVGIGIDALIRRRRIIYEAPPRTMRLALPIVVRRAAGLQLTLHF